MRTLNDSNVITRRGLFQRVGGIWACGGVLSLVNSEKIASGLASADDPKSDSAPLRGKIALEEHFVIPETLSASYGAPGSPEFQRRLEEIGSARIAEMDRGGLDVCILSLVGDGIQAIPDVSEAIRIARRANDHLAEQIAKNPKTLQRVCRIAAPRPTGRRAGINTLHQRIGILWRARQRIFADRHGGFHCLL